MRQKKRNRLQQAGEVRRDWIIKNNERGKVRRMQAILQGIISVGVDASRVNFDMRGMKNEIDRIERLLKVREMQNEWEMRMILEAERKELRDRKENAKKWRDCREIV